MFELLGQGIATLMHLKYLVPLVIGTLIGVIGGTMSKGIMGLFLGPVVVAVSWQLLLVWLNSDGEAASPPMK